MSVISWLFGKKPDTHCHTDDTDLKEQLNRAVMKQTEATRELREAQLRQASEATYIRETLRGVLHRIEERKDDEAQKR